MGLIQDLLGYVRPSRQLPQPQVDGNYAPLQTRGSRYGEVAVQLHLPSKKALADEGSKFVVTNPTIGTGVAHALVTAFSDTAALFAIKNNNQPGGKRIYLDRLTLMLTAAPTAGVSLEFAGKLDSGNRQPTANNVERGLTNAANVNGDDNTASNAIVQAFSAGSLTVPASTSAARTVMRAKLPVGLNVVGDVYELLFGRDDQGAPAAPLTAIKAAQPAKVVADCPAIIIAPQQWFVLYRWALTEATGAPSYEYELAYIER